MISVEKFLAENEAKAVQQTKLSLLDKLLEEGKLNTEDVGNLLKQKVAEYAVAKQDKDNFVYPPMFIPWPMDTELPGSEIQRTEARLRREVEALTLIANKL